MRHVATKCGQQWHKRSHGVAKEAVLHVIIELTGDEIDRLLDRASYLLKTTLAELPGYDSLQDHDFNANNDTAQFIIVLRSPDIVEVCSDEDMIVQIGRDIFKDVHKRVEQLME